VLEYLQRQLPEGVGMRVTSTEMRALPEQLRARADGGSVEARAE